MITITIEIPEGKRAEWVNGVLTLVDKQPVEFKYKVGDKVTHKSTGNKTYTITATRAENGKAYYYFIDEEGCPHCNYQESELEPYTEPKDITERIKTFEDACKWCTENGHFKLRREYDCIVTDTLILDEVSKDLLAYLKLRIITCALNEGWEPTFENGEGRWFVCADEIATDEISVCSADGVISYNESAMLLFKSSELAEYAATQFKDIYMDFCKGKE